MIRRTWLLAVSLLVLSGCGRHRAGVVSDDVMRDLSVSIHKDRPGQGDPAPANPPSPDHVRGTGPTNDEQTTPG